MRKFIVLIAVVLGLIAVPQALAATIQVSITRAGFVPDPVNVKVGDTVTWTNRDTTPHQVVSTQCGFASPILQPNQTYSYTFTRAAKCAYEDPTARPRLRGTVNVAAAPAGVSITVRPTIVFYGRAATLSGTISSGAANERLTVFAQACGAQFTKLADVTTTTGGAWTLVVKPTINTTYRVQFKNVTSANVTVKVRPRMNLGKIAPKTFRVRVSAAATFAGKVATLQRYNATTRRWVKVRLVTLRATTLGIAPTVVSQATFRSAVRARTRLRLILPQTQVGGCYAPGISNTIRA